MANIYTLTKHGDGAIRSSDNAYVPWDATLDQPLDINGLAGRTWVADGSPKSRPYVTPWSIMAVKSECGRRIYAVASDNAQKNMTANFTAGFMSAEDQLAYKAGVEWITNMQAVCHGLIISQEPDFMANAAWPICPAEVIALAQRY